MVNFRFFGASILGRVVCLCVAVLSLSLPVSQTHAQQETLELQRFEKLAANLVKRWQIENSVLVDARMVSVIGGGLNHFNQIYGWRDNPMEIQSKTATLLENEDGLFHIIDEFIKDSYTGNQVKTVFALCAEAIGSSASASGWSNSTENGYAYVDLNGKIPYSPAKLVSESLASSTAVLAVGAVVGPGKQELIFENGEVIEFVVRKPGLKSNAMGSSVNEINRNNTSRGR